MKSLESTTTPTDITNKVWTILKDEKILKQFCNFFTPDNFFSFTAGDKTLKVIFG